MSVKCYSHRVPFLLPSTGFSASLGINQTRLNFTAPGMRLPSQSFCTRLSEMPHFAAASAQDTYSIFAPVLSAQNLP